MSTTEIRGVAGASDRITEAVTAWPGVTAGIGRRGEYGFTFGGRALGHLHGDYTAHFGFPKDVWEELVAAGRVTEHPVFPGKAGPAARRIETDDDVDDVIALLRLNYERAASRNSGANSSKNAAKSDTSPE